MEVRGSVLVRDVCDEEYKDRKYFDYKKYLKSAYQMSECSKFNADGGTMQQETNDENALNAEKLLPSDGVPRILVKGFRKGLKLWTLFSSFNKFGPLTYIVIVDQIAVLEFYNREVVVDILRLKVLRIEDATVKVHELTRFPHAEPQQLEFQVNEEISAALTSVSSFNEYMDSLLRASEAKLNKESDLKVCRILEKCLGIIFPDCKAYRFGSRTSGLGLPDCDLDIFLDSGEMYDGTAEQDNTSQEYLVQSAYKVLAKHDDFRYVEAVPRARTPILRFLHVPSDTRCDVAFRHGLGIENTNLIIFLMSVEPRLKTLIMFLKRSAQLHELRGTRRAGQFSSYALVLMLIYYLQQLPEPVLPPISTLQTLHKGEKLIIAGWECSFTTDHAVVPATVNKQSVLDLLEGFSYFYRKFDYERLVICPLMGKAIMKSAFNGNMSSLQPTMSRYLQLINNNEAEKFRYKCPISVQDPFDLSHNVTRSVKIECLMTFISICGITQKLLANLR